MNIDDALVAFRQQAKVRWPHRGPAPIHSLRKWGDRWEAVSPDSRVIDLDRVQVFDHVRLNSVWWHSWSSGKRVIAVHVTDRQVTIKNAHDVVKTMSKEAFLKWYQPEESYWPEPDDGVQGPRLTEINLPTPGATE